MSSKQRIIPQVDSLQVISDLLDMAKHPEKITEAQETVRKQIQLTEAEENRMAEARAFMAKYVETTHELKLREDALVAARAVHEQGMRDFQANKEAQNQIFVDKERDLNAKEANLNESIRIHEAAKTQLKQEKDNAAYLNQRREDAVKKREDDCKRREDAMAAEAERLAKIRGQLDRKANLVAQALES